MANRIITAAVTGETIKLSNKTAGAAGSFNAVSLSLTFDSAWDETLEQKFDNRLYELADESKLFVRMLFCGVVS